MYVTASSLYCTTMRVLLRTGRGKMLSLACLVLAALGAPCKPVTEAASAEAASSWVSGPTPQWPRQRRRQKPPSARWLARSGLFVLQPGRRSVWAVPWPGVKGLHVIVERRLRWCARCASAAPTHARCWRAQTTHSRQLHPTHACARPRPRPPAPRPPRRSPAAARSSSPTARAATACTRSGSRTAAAAGSSP